MIIELLVRYIFIILVILIIIVCITYNIIFKSHQDKKIIHNHIKYYELSEIELKKNFDDDYLNDDYADYKYLNYQYVDGTNHKYVCMYAYYEKDQSYKENLIYFLENGLLNNVDYYIIINGECTVNIPNLINIKVIKRENYGYDFGAWNYCINNYIKKSYDYYIFINTSVRGPYIKDPKTNWLNEFLKLFNDPDVKLVGTSINIFNDFLNGFGLKKIYKYDGPYIHVQSMFFILNKDSFKLLKTKDFFNSTYTNFAELIAYKEIGMSHIILNNGWNINCMLPKYRDREYRTLKKNFNPSNDNPYGNGNYFGKSIDPYDVIFYKINKTNIDIHTKSTIIGKLKNLIYKISNKV